MHQYSGCESIKIGFALQNLIVLAVDTKVNVGIITSSLLFTPIASRAKIFKPFETIYLRYPDPKEPVVGRSPIEAMAYEIDIDHYIAVYERAFFKNSARPDVIIKYPEELESPEEADRIREQFFKKFGTPEFAVCQP